MLTGNEKAFAAGADIAEMGRKVSSIPTWTIFWRHGNEVAFYQKPIIAAVSGYALGGGCELALLCDFIIAAETRSLDSRRSSMGILPGIGATQRLPRVIGKSIAMDMILTGRMIDAEEAERMGLVARIIPGEKLVEEAVETAQHIASFSRPVVYLARECVNRAFETSLAEGIRFERRMFHASFATEGQKEGMEAFIEKRPAHFSDR